MAKEKVTEYSKNLKIELNNSQIDVLKYIISHNGECHAIDESDCYNCIFNNFDKTNKKYSAFIKGRCNSGIRNNNLIKTESETILQTLKLNIL